MFICIFLIFYSYFFYPFSDRPIFVFNKVDFERVVESFMYICVIECSYFLMNFVFVIFNVNIVELKNVP